jgi:hypothetical protein
MAWGVGRTSVGVGTNFRGKAESDVAALLATLWGIDALTSCLATAETEVSSAIAGVCATTQASKDETLRSRTSSNPIIRPGLRPESRRET